MSATDVQDPADRAAAAAAAHAAECTCGEANEDLPEINAQTIPHAIRHAAIFGAVDALAPHGGIIISSNHNPVPLLSQLQTRYGDTRSVTYLDKGPDVWRVLVRNETTHGQA